MERGLGFGGVLVGFVFFCGCGFRGLESGRDMGGRVFVLWYHPWIVSVIVYALLL